MIQKLAICVVGIYCCFLTWGITQERVSTAEYDGKRFKYFIFLNTLQALAASIVAYFYSLVRGSSIDKMTTQLLRPFVRISILGCLASPLGYASLKHLDYPTVILGKSSKLVPVMLMNFLIYRKTYPVRKYLVVALITIGVSCFMLFDPKKKDSKTESSLYGLALLTANLLMDGAINTSQDNIFKKFKINGTSMMFYMNLITTFFLSTYLLLYPLDTQLHDALDFCQQHPQIIIDLLLFSLAGAIGQCFIFYTLESFGSLVLVTVTVTRKMFSILLSVFWFGHKLTFYQWISVATVFGAISWDATSKSSSMHKDEEVILKEKENEKKKK